MDAGQEPCVTATINLTGFGAQRRGAANATYLLGFDGGMVYIPETYSGLEDLIGTMAKNSREKSGEDAYEANAYVIKGALDAGRITKDQVKTLVNIARKIRAF